VASRAGEHPAAAVEAFRKVRGSVLYDYQFSAGTYIPKAKPWAPARLRSAIGDEYFQEVTQVTLGRPVTDATLAHLEGLDRTESLSVFYPGPGDGLKSLHGLTRLEEVALRGRGVDDAGLVHLTRLPRLWKLNLRDSMVSDAGTVLLPEFAAVSELSSATRRSPTPGSHRCSG